MSTLSIPKLLKLKDYITLTGTMLGVTALICACIGTREVLSLGFFLISIALGVDLTDGYIARKTGTMNEIGKELDSLSDSLTFGIAPAILSFQAFKVGGILDLFIMIGSLCFIFGAILRLARFNISKIPGYTGIPTPLSALSLITYFYANYFYAFAKGGIEFPFLSISSYLIPFFMILVGWFNITTYIKFGEKDRVVYLTFLIVAPICPILGIIGILNPNFTISIIVSIFFLFCFVFILAFFIRRFFIYILRKEKESNL